MNTEIEKLRNKNFYIIEKWVKLHIETCDTIINSINNQEENISTKDSTRVMVAEETIED